jgi:carbon-monoxide dehydrogenase large subunit
VTGRAYSFIGQPVLRREDLRFVSGCAQFVDDLSPSRALHGFVVRSPWSRGDNLRVDVASARRMPGIRLVLTADDLTQTDIAHVPVDFPPPGHSFETWSASPQPVLARDKVNYVGDPLAFIVADTIHAARAAAEALVIRLKELESVVDLSISAADFCYYEGDGAAVGAAMKAASSVFSATIAVNRIDAFPLEPRGCIGAFSKGQFTLYVSTQRVQIIQRALADHVFKVPRERMRVVAPDTGGGFGQKNGLYPEYVLCLEAARRLRRPVKWIPERGETLNAGCHARDNLFSVSAAIGPGGRMTAIDAVCRMNLGAYASSRSMVRFRTALHI